MKSIEFAIYNFLLEMLNALKPDYTSDDVDIVKREAKRLANALEL